MRTATEEFIVSCLREDTPESLAKALAVLVGRSSGIDWAVILSKGYRLAPYIYFQARKACPDLPIPKDIVERMQQQYFQTFASNVELRRVAAELALEFAREKIGLVFLKGVAALATVYKEDPGLRSMGDVDVLVRKKDLPAAQSLLERLGYAKIQGHEVPSGPDRSHWFHDRYNKKPIALELHWDIDLKENPVLMERLFLSSETVAFEGAEGRILGPEGSLLMACINFARDLGGALWQPFEFDPVRRRGSIFYEAMPLFLEIKTMVRFYGARFDWDLFLALAKSSGRKRQIALLLIMAKKIVHADIPEQVLRKIKSNFLVILNMFLLGRNPKDDLAPLFSIEGTLADLGRRTRLVFKNRTTLQELINRYCRPQKQGLP